MTWRPGAFATLSFLAAVASCARSPRMCVAESGCGAGASCVAGRCLSRGAVPAIATARRVLVDPVDVAYLRPGAGPAAAGLATLGRGDRALLLLRFSVPLPPEVSVVEAYLVMDRATDVDADPAPVTLHVARVVDAWDGGSTSWARQPRLEEVGAAETRVLPSSGGIVRLEVRSVVERWRRRARDEMGVAVVTEGSSTTGLAFALPPRLELYVR
jgi:hypothetical protein